jgi:uncharacterized damage-inducible protein DinB
MASLTPEERSAALAELEASRRRLLDALEGLTEEEWRDRPSPERWSIAECAEHITAAELPLPKFAAVSLTAEPSEEERRQIRGKDDFVRRFLRDRSQRGEAPERIRPKGRFATREDTVRAFEERRAANLAYVRETADPLRDRYALHPFAGLIDGYQWVLFLAAHTDRHAKQIEETRSQFRHPERSEGSAPG